MAKEDPKKFPGIGKDITGIVFLGTPHQGSPYAAYATIMAQTTNFLIIGSQVSRLAGTMRPDILRALKKHAPELSAIADDFKRYAPGIKIKSFVEGKKTQGLNRRVSSPSSRLKFLLYHRNNLLFSDRRR
jgi:hypothetical protein